MKLELVTSLELSKQLKEAGSPQESIFHWRLCHPGRHDYTDGTWFWKICFMEDGEDLSGKEDEYAAFLAGELGEMLPEEIATDKGYIEWTTKIIGKHWCVWYGEKNVIHWTQGTTEADARAKMWLYLKTHGLLKTTEAREGQ